MEDKSVVYATVRLVHNNGPLVVFYNSQSCYASSISVIRRYFLWHTKYEWGLWTRPQRAWHCFCRQTIQVQMHLLFSALFHSLLMHSVSFLLTVMPPLYRRCHIKGDRTWLDTAHFISSTWVHFMLTFLVLLCPHLLITLNVVQGKSHLPSTFQPWWVKMIMVCVCVARFYRLLRLLQ